LGGPESEIRPELLLLVLLMLLLVLVLVLLLVLVLVLNTGDGSGGAFGGPDCENRPKLLDLETDPELEDNDDIDDDAFSALALDTDVTS